MTVAARAMLMKEFFLKLLVNLLQLFVFPIKFTVVRRLCLLLCLDNLIGQEKQFFDTFASLVIDNT